MSIFTGKFRLFASLVFGSFLVFYNMSNEVYARLEAADNVGTSKTFISQINHFKIFVGGNYSLGSLTSDKVNEESKLARQYGLEVTGSMYLDFLGLNIGIQRVENRFGSSPDQRNVNNLKSNAGLIEINPFYRLSDQLAIGPLYQRSFSGGIKYVPSPNQNIDEFISKDIIGVNGLYEFTWKNNNWRAGGHILKPLGVDGRNIWFFKASIEMGFDVFSRSGGVSSSQDNKNLEQIKISRNQSPLKRIDEQTNDQKIALDRDLEREFDEISSESSGLEKKSEDSVQIKSMKNQKNDLDAQKNLNVTSSRENLHGQNEVLKKRNIEIAANSNNPVESESKTKILAEVKKDLNNGVVLDEHFVYFRPTQTTLTTRSKTYLWNFAQVLKNNPNLWSKLVIVGHSDKTGKLKLNRSLSLKRAKTVHDLFSKAGLHPGKLSYQGKGHEDLVDEGDTDSAHMRNRRVEFHFKGITHKKELEDKLQGLL